MLGIDLPKLIEHMFSARHCFFPRFLYALFLENFMTIAFSKVE